MTTYSVADAKNGLPRLIDRALEGEEVIISRHGKAVVEIRSLVTSQTKDTEATYDWLRARRLKPRVPVNSVDLLRQMYEDPDG